MVSKTNRNQDEDLENITDGDTTSVEKNLSIYQNYYPDREANKKDLEVSVVVDD